MAQLSIYDKLRHHSDKDFTCSVGKCDRIYITFRHETWKRFTTTDYISVYIGKGGALKFGDPKVTKMLAPCFKLHQSKVGDEETREKTRYLQIEGKKYPAILDRVRQCAGSYDFPEPKVITTEEPKKERIEDIKAKLGANLKKIKENEIKLRVYTKEETAADAFTVRRNQFKEDLKTLTEGVESQEERIAIINALAGLYGRNNKTVPYDPTDPWDIP